MTSFIGQETIKNQFCEELTFSTTGAGVFTDQLVGSYTVPAGEYIKGLYFKSLVESANPSNGISELRYSISFKTDSGILNNTAYSGSLALIQDYTDDYSDTVFPEGTIIEVFVSGNTSGANITVNTAIWGRTFNQP